MSRGFPRVPLSVIGALGLVATACTAPNPAFVRGTDGGGDALAAAAPRDVAIDEAADTRPATDGPLVLDGGEEEPAVDAPAGGAQDASAGADVAIDGAFSAADGPPTADSAPPAPDRAPIDNAVTTDAASTLQLGLVGHWALDEGTGLVARDQGSLGNDGQLHGGATWTGFGAPAHFADPNSLSLDGVDGEVQASVHGLPGIGEAKTIALWVWFAAPLPASVRKNLVAFSASTSNVGIQLGFDSGRAALWLRGDNTDLVLSGVLAAQTWYHVAYAFDGNLHQLYVNGVLVDSSSAAKDVGTATSLFFGSYGGTTQHFGGRIDDIRFYDRTLTGAEVLALSQGW